MSSFLNFIEKLANHFDLEFDSSKIDDEDEYRIAANVLSEVNQFLYQKKGQVPGLL